LYYASFSPMEHKKMPHHTATEAPTQKAVWLSDYHPLDVDKPIPPYDIDTVPDDEASDDIPMEIVGEDDVDSLPVTKRGRAIRLAFREYQSQSVLINKNIGEFTQPRKCTSQSVQLSGKEATRPCQTGCAQEPDYSELCARAQQPEALEMQQAHRVMFSGEFGCEMLNHLPYVYWNFKRGALQSTVGCGAMAAFYPWSPNHTDDLSCSRSRPYNWMALRCPV